jgi:hypothetical protein
MTERYIQHLPQFRVYNREQELARREREQKESAWEQELLQAMGASDPTGSQHSSNEDHKVLASDNKGKVDTPRAGLLNTDTSLGENRGWQLSRSGNCTSTVRPNVDQTNRSSVVSNFMRTDEIGRRHSDHSYKGMCTEVLPLVRNKSEVASCEDDMPQEATNQHKYNVLCKKIYKASEHSSRSSVSEPEHCRSCPKLFMTEQSISGSDLSLEPLCGQNVQEDNVTCRNKQKTCGVPKNEVSLDDSCKCQITDKDSTNSFHIQSPSLDNGSQNQGVSYNIQSQLSEIRKSVKEHSIKNDTVSNSIDHSLSQCQGSSAVRQQNLECSKPGSSKNHLNST